MDHTRQLKQLIYSCPELMLRLQYLRDIHTHAYLSAGVIRNLVWSILHHQDYGFDQIEIDVIFYDLNDQQGLKEQRLTELLKQKFPNNEWDVVNQAYVHLWYKTDDGSSISQYQSLFDALSVWVETATAIAVRLLENDDIEIIAPFGLNDLFELKLRWNKRLVSYSVFLARIQAKQFLTRWKSCLLWMIRGSGFKSIKP